MSPGTLLHPGEKRIGQMKLSIFDYDKDTLNEKENANIEECLVYLDSPSITWINIEGVTDPKVMEMLGHQFSLHPLMLEDILSSGQRSKLDDYKTSLFVVIRYFYYNETTQAITNEQISLVLGSNYVLSFSEEPSKLFDPIKERLRKPRGLMRSSGADYMCYALIDCIVDHYFLVLEKIEGEVDTIDKEIFTRPDSRTLHRIQRLKREIIGLRKGIWPMREVLSHMRRIETPLINEQTKVFLHDVYDHTIQAIDTIENFRDLVSGMLEVYLSHISHKMNEIMKVLTVVSTIFVPLTFIASIYGMNFDHMPELHTEHGYFSVLGLMFILCCCMLYYFRRKKWL